MICLQTYSFICSQTGSIICSRTCSFSLNEPNTNRIRADLKHSKNKRAELERTPSIINESEPSLNRLKNKRIKSNLCSTRSNSTSLQL